MSVLCLLAALSSCHEPSTTSPGTTPAQAGASQGPTEAPQPGQEPEGLTGPISRVDDCELPMSPDPGQINIARRVEYARIDGQALHLDIAWPRGEGPYPLVIAIHGGSWSVGDRSDKDDLIQRLAVAGYAAASLDYRLISGRENLFPAAIEDVRCALRFLRASNETYSLDPERVVAMGESAGGHLALLLALASDVGGLDGACERSGDVQISGAIATASPSDMRPSSAFARAQPTEVRLLLGAPPDRTGELARLASPIVHADRDDPPILLVHGTEDEGVPIAESRSLQERLRELGVASTLVELEGAGHDIPDMNDGSPFRPGTCTILAFLEAVLSPAR